MTPDGVQSKMDAYLPSFLVCGAQKSGTTALYDALVEHPDVCMSRPKETEFFNWNYRRGWDWFATHFSHYDGEAAVGEASTRTMATPLAPTRIQERLPDVKLIFVLRNPISRAYSAFWYYVAQGILCANDDFSRFIRAEGHPLRQEIIFYGRYDEHLDRFLKRFDRSQMLILFHSNLLAEPASQIRTLFSFIGVSATADASTLLRRKNVTRYPASSGAYAWAKSVWRPMRATLTSWAPSLVDTLQQTAKGILLQSSRPPLADADRDYLMDLYMPTIQALKERYNLDVPDWT